MSAWIPWAALFALAVVVARHLRSESSARRKNEEQQQATLGEVLGEITSLRSALLASGAVERPAKLPPPAPPSTRRVQAPEEPPSTKPVRSRTVPAPPRHEAEADVKDARPAPPPLEATLASAVSPVDRPAALPRPNADGDPEDGRDTGEDMTKVFSKRPADPLAGVPLERPTSSATRAAEAFRRRPTLPGGLTATPGDEQDTGGEP